MEDTEADRARLHQTNSDPTIFALSDLRLFRPQQKRSSDEVLKAIARSLLAVWICVPALEGGDGDEKKGDDAKKNEDPKKSEEVTIVGFMVLTEGGLELAQNRSVTLGIAVTEEFQGKGYGPEAINWAVDWAFRFGNMHAIRLGTVEFNTRAQKVYKKLGFVEDGRSREAVYFDRKWWDTVSFSLLEREWMALRGIEA